MLIDKNKSRHHGERISEGALFFWAIFFGGIGIYIGMYVVHHKTKKWYFAIGMPLIIIQNIAFLFSRMLSNTVQISAQLLTS